MLYQFQSAITILTLTNDIIDLGDCEHLGEGMGLGGGGGGGDPRVPPSL